MAREVLVLEAPRILKEKHLKLRVSQQGTIWEAVGWGMGEQAPRLKEGSRVDLAFSPEENFYRDISTLQLNIKGIRCPASSSPRH